MYYMIQEMGHGIVRGAYINNLGQQTRLWDFQEVCDVLTNNRGTEAIESLALDFSQIFYIHFSSHAFIKMPNVRLLAFNDNWRSNNTMSISGSFELLQGLRFLRLDNYPLKSIPSFCHMDKLVVLSMPCSNLEKLLNGAQVCMIYNMCICFGRE
ncbi:hypothetical protein TanjilG_31609 [Lupinus angustifolius]|uniref:Leucine-rich repeat-containing N-terminal plant-type domain-containing protein n=1 Tax=Lupinus angustifolius TaxID=3871 RepID=A0A4P1RJQ7_LUPAN|nr:PREDICTED: probable WRKY transcription factor 19 [Lupinus angustifolius]OIW11859.1 hypothetical protein TanjilG_31609 [Lupinus angustifolius]